MPVFDEEEYSNWLEKAGSGEMAIYYSGFLYRDKEMLIQSADNNRDYHHKSFMELIPPRMKAAKAAWNSHLDGRVFLFQQKVKPYVYDYYAVKR